MAETLLQKAQRLGIKPEGQPSGETLAQKAERLGIQPAPAQQGYFQGLAQIPRNIIDTQRESFERGVGAVTGGAQLMSEGKPIRGALKASLGTVTPTLGALFAPFTETAKALIPGGGYGSQIAEGATTGAALGGPVGAAVGAGFSAVAPVISMVKEIPRVKNFIEKYPEANDIFDGALALGLTALGSRSKQSGILDKPVSQAIPQMGTNLLSTAKVPLVAAKFVADKVGSTGVGQYSKEVAQRFPRLLGRAKEGVEKASERAQTIKNSPRVVGKALESGLDQRVINTVVDADKPTRQAYADMVKIADTTGTKLKPTQRPEIVAGKVASEQYKVIDAARRRVGAEIGKEADALSVSTKVPMKQSYDTLDSILQSQGVSPVITEKGVKLDFSGSKYTPAERTRITELYKLSSEGGHFISSEGFVLTPKQVYAKDQLFSKLQRETRMEGIGDIIVNTPSGQSNLFKVFRDVFSKALEKQAPKIKPLNAEYRKLVTLQDDIENSIIKGGNFDTTSRVDPAEFAQTNLRRILSDAQSATSYREILSKMDSVARSLGYVGAKADDLIAFATELRRIYPDAVPATSFSGGIRTGVGALLKQVIEAGKPNLVDQQRALRDLLSDAGASLKSKSPLVPSSGRPIQQNPQAGFGRNPFAVSDVAPLAKPSGIPLQKSMLNDTKNTLSMYDKYITSGDFKANDVYKDVPGKVFQPSVAEQILSNIQNGFITEGYSDVGVRFMQNIPLTEITPEVITDTLSKILRDIKN